MHLKVRLVTNQAIGIVVVVATAKISLPNLFEFIKTIRVSSIIIIIN